MKIINKKEVEKAIKEYMSLDRIFYIFVVKNKNINISYVNIKPYKTIFNVDINYKTNNEKQRIYKKVIEIIKSFDFSFTLEFYDLKTLEDFYIHEDEQTELYLNIEELIKGDFKEIKNELEFNLFIEKLNNFHTFYYVSDEKEFINLKLI